jgi:DNA-binding transcriptional regulator/RsmH inhibitor MraZ
MVYNIFKWDKVGKMKFNGNYENHLDNKGRMIVPAKFRKILGKSIVVSLEFENALVLRTTEDFNS